MSHPSSRISRRSFLAAGALAAVSPLVLQSRILGREGVIPPSEKIRIAMIGYGNRGSEIMNDFLNDRNNYQMIGVCDCFKEHLDAGISKVNQFYNNTDCQAYTEYEEVLDRADIDAVAVATPDHWHTKITVEACKAGKDVYCEKPLTHTPAESRQIVAAARKYNRVCTSGSQRVYQDYGHMAPIIQSGAIGEVKEAYFECGGPPDDAYFPEEPVPDGFDWDRWLGPAPWVPYNFERCSGNYGSGWRRYSDYGNGFLADWGAHKLGAILYILGIDNQEPLEILPPKSERNPENCLTFIFPGGIKIHHVRDNKFLGPDKRINITFIGSEREYWHADARNEDDRYNIRPLHQVDVRRYNGGERSLHGDFAYSIRHRLRPFQDLFYGAICATCCQLAHYTYKLNRPLKWDAEKTAFIDDEQANRYVSRPKRSPYEIKD